MTCPRCNKQNKHGKTYCRACEDDLQTYRNNMCVNCNRKQSMKNKHLCDECITKMAVGNAVIK